MREIHGSAEAIIAADPRRVFDLITAVKRLPEWNAAIEEVVDWPGALAPGSTWTVQIHPNRMMRWKSVSTTQEVDVDAKRFAYRTVNADGNPSYALWSWDVTPEGSGAKVVVRWDISLETIDRRLLAGPIRRRQLRGEVATSLKALTNALTGAAR